eukprot:m.107303 g.107303  ORF g.107303 m.107303 type:complete len:401 (+) comp51700_c0_seq6:257-1459(+)
MFIIRRVFRLRVADRAYCCKTCAFPVAWRMHQGRLCFRAQSRALCSAAAHHPSHCTAAGQTEAAANTANAGHRASESGCIAPAAAVTAAAVTATATGARRSTATVASSAVRIRSGASPAPLQPFLSKTLVRLAHSQLPPTFVVLLPRLKQPQIPRLQPAKMSQATAASRLSARLGTPASASGVQLAAPNHPVWQIANDLREQLQAEAQSAATAPGRKRHQEARPPLVHNEAALKASLEKAKTPATKPPSQPLSSSTKASTEPLKLGVLSFAEILEQKRQKAQQAASAPAVAPAVVTSTPAPSAAPVAARRKSVDQRPAARKSVDGPLKRSASRSGEIDAKRSKDENGDHSATQQIGLSTEEEAFEAELNDVEGELDYEGELEYIEGEEIEGDDLLQADLE